MSIFGIGTVVVDHSVLLDRYPACDTKSNIRQSWKQVGGPVPVALSTASHFGSSCRFLGRWGEDDAGRRIFKTLSRRGIDLTPSSSHGDWRTGFAQVWVTRNGERTIAYSRGEFPLPLASDISHSLFEERSILHLDGWAGEAALAAARLMKEQGGTVVLDAGSMKPGTRNLFEFVDILIASGLFRRSCFGEDEVSNSDLLALGCKSIITTHGAAGSRWISADDIEEHTGFDIEPADTNGAGDIFSGAILHSILNRESKINSLRFANAVAALACRHYGNSKLPTLAEVIQLVEIQSDH